MPYRRRRVRRRRSARAIVGLASGILVVTGAVAAVLAAAAWHDLRPVQNELRQARRSLLRVVDDPAAFLTPEQRAATAAQLDETVGVTGQALDRVRGSKPLRLIGLTPVLSRQRSGLVDLLDDAQTAAISGRRLLAQLETLDERTRVRDGTVPFEGMSQLATAVDTAGRELRDLNRSSSWLWASLGAARREFNEVTTRTSSRLLEGAEALKATRSFMGAGGDRRHLIAVQNNAEMRDQGMVLSFAVVRFTGGRLSLERNGSVNELPLDRPAPTPVPPGTSQVFGSLQPTQLWQSVNATADFAWSGKAMADMYRQATGEPIDGVIAVDVPGLAALLRVVGPVDVAGMPETITADNAGRILLHDQYEGLPPNSEQTLRRERLSDTTRAVVDRLTTGTYDTAALGRQLGDAAAGGHFRLWSPVGEEEKGFERTGLGGGPAAIDADRTFHVAVETRAATKMDYYVRAAVRQDVTLTADGDARIRTTVVIDNQAPQGAQPSAQLGPDAYNTDPDVRPGDYSAWVLLWGPPGAVQPGSTPESGLSLSQGIVALRAGERKEVVFDTLLHDAVRDGRLELRLVPQSRAEPMDLSVHVDANGWQVSEPQSWEGEWDRVHTLTWRVHG